MRPEHRRTFILLSVAGSAIALMVMPAIYFLGLWLAPPRPVPAAASVPALLGDALWARAEGGRATELQAIGPLSFIRMRACRAFAAQTDDQSVRAARRADCMKLLPAVQAADYLSGVHMRDEHAANGGIREGLSQFATAAWVTRSWTRAQLLNTLAERGAFGFGWRGVEAASRGYFGRSASALSLPQAAMLAAFIGDRGVDPWCDPAGAAEMRRRVLERMRDNLAIDERALDRANLSDLALSIAPPDHKPCGD